MVSPNFFVHCRTGSLENIERHETEDDWLEEIIADFAWWFVFAYIKTVGKEQTITLGYTFVMTSNYILTKTIITNIPFMAKNATCAFFMA